MRNSIFFVAIIGLCLLMATPGSAQRKLSRFTDAPGKIAFQRLIAEPAIGGYTQPVMVHVPEGGEVAYWSGDWNGGSFSNSQFSQSLLGMQIGPVYQLKTTALSKGQIIDVYPTIELVDRLYPPNGFATRHPVQIVFTTEDIEAANGGDLVTKIVYLEDPDTALPYRLRTDEQSTIDVGFGQDPLHAARRLGRPLAIVRLGSRKPSEEQVFIYSPIPLFDDASISDATPATNHMEGCFCSACQQVYNCCPKTYAKMPKSRRDEYVCDGNDRDLPAAPGEDWQVDGLDIEDTVAQFDTEDGRVLIAPSNRVCIYSPRFASVRRKLQSNDTTITQRLNVANKNLEPIAAERTQRSSLAQQNLQPKSNKQTQTANAFRDQTRGVSSDNVVRLLGARHFFKPFEDLSLIRFGKFETSESARVSLGMQSAIAWNSDVSAQITIDKDQPVIVNDVNRAVELISIDTKTSSDLRLCKLASRISAKPGDVIDFTIRFDNIGRKRIGNVTILDNLSPRLEYVNESAECSVDANFKTETNKAGSEKLIWEIIDPLKIGDGGIVRFQCRVR